MGIVDVMRGDFRDWRGLQEDATVASLAAQLAPIARMSAGAQSLRGQRRFVITTIERPSPPRLIEIWVEFGTNRPVAIEFDDPMVLSLEDTLRWFGPPDLVLSDRWFAAESAIREFVFARRGVALSIAEPLAGAPNTGRSLARVQLFHATTPESFLTNLDRGTEMSPKTHPSQGSPA